MTLNEEKNDYNCQSGEGFESVPMTSLKREFRNLVESLSTPTGM
jgi:hypothetical protein